MALWSDAWKSRMSSFQCHGDSPLPVSFTDPMVIVPPESSVTLFASQ